MVFTSLTSPTLFLLLIVELRRRRERERAHCAAEIAQDKEQLGAAQNTEQSQSASRGSLQRLTSREKPGYREWEKLRIRGQAAADEGQRSISQRPTQEQLEEQLAIHPSV